MFVKNIIKVINNVLNENTLKLETLLLKNCSYKPNDNNNRLFLSKEL